MITISKLKEYSNFRFDRETEALCERLNQSINSRSEPYLDIAEFDSILHWKLRNQYNRQLAHRNMNNSEIISTVTKAAFSIQHPDKYYELDLKVSLLCAIRGVAVPVASAILTLVYPHKYAVIDFRNWRQVFGIEKKSFSLPDYRKYMKRIWKFSKELNWSPQEIDFVIWEYDRRHGHNN